MAYYAVITPSSSSRLSAIVSILIWRVRVRDYGALSKVNHNELAYYFFLLEMF